ncbi:Guanine nucleotide exchange factor lte1, variant 2 [Basidiobolus ranarum]|uniref:Guanine nucleotide exchange factor lte1, variant 2 n=1 Tax=Basidiobolus ranarum TaxID=34480 RepID=A0ABR2VR02_9FUNG
MWPNTWKSHLVKKTEPSTTQYKAQKSTQKLFLTDVKKGILEKNSTIELTTTTKRISRDIVHDLINATTTYSQQTEQYSQFEVAQAFEITEDYSIAKLQMIKSAEASKRARIAFSTHKSNGKKDQISESLNNVSAGLYPIQQANLVASKSQPKSAPSKAKAFSRSGKSLSAATVETLIDILVNGADYRFISDFFISYRLFMSPVQLCKSLVSKFLDSLRAELVKSRKIRIQIHLIIKYWLKEYFTYDFASSVTLSFTLKNFLKSMLNHPQIIKFSEDIKLIFSLYELYQCKKLTSADSIQSTLRSLTSLSEHVDQGNDHSKQLGHKTSFDSIVSSTSECTAKSNLYRNKLALLNLPIEPPDDASLNQWTMRMACSLANSKSRIPEIYNSIIFGTSQPTDRRQNMRTSRSSSTSNGYIVDMEVPGSPVTSSPNDRNGNSRHKRSFLFSYSTETIAQQFCIIEQRCLCAVEWHELVEVRWKPDSGKDSHEKCSGVLSQIDRFNIMCQWVATEIVTCDHIEERARIIEKLVRIAMVITGL